MGVGIERVVDRHAGVRAEAEIGVAHRVAAAIGQHQVQDRQHEAQRMGVGAAQLGQRRRGVDVEKDTHRVNGASV